MHLKGFLKRFAPFFITFALGLFVASFFVTVALPSVRFNRNHRHQRFHRQMEFENQRLREENLRLKRAVEDISETKNIDGTGKIMFEGTINDLVPPPPIAPVRTAPYLR